MRITKQLELFEEKKHSVRYNAPKADNDPLVSSIYVMKAHLPRPFPQSITLTIEETVVQPS